MSTAVAVEKTELILGEGKIKETLLRIIQYRLDFVVLGVVQKTKGKRFLVRETGFQHPLWKIPGGKPKLSGEFKENPLNVILMKIVEKIGIITSDPKTEDIFLIQELRNRKGNSYYVIVFDLKYFSGNVEKGKGISELKEFTKNEVFDAIYSNKMIPSHVPIWKYYINNLWK